MNLTKNAIKRTALATAITTTLGLAALPEQVSARTLTFNISGWFTMLDPSGTSPLVNGDASTQGFYGNRTAFNGTMTFDDVTNAGSLAVAPFSFFAGGPAAATSVTFQDIDGPGGAGTLMLGNMGFNWSGSNGIPVSIVWDGQGMLDAITQGAVVGATIGTTGATYACDTNIACATPATDGFLFGAKASYTLPIGASPVTTSTFNTTDIGTIGLGTNPSGTLPLIADTIGGSPMKAGPFPGFYANFDINSMTLTSDGSGPNFTQPADINFTAPEQATPASINVDLGTVTDETGGTTIEYSTDGKAINDVTKTWILDNGTTNTIVVNAAQTVTTLTVDWRATNMALQSFQTQNVTVTITDTTAPVINSTNAQPVSVSVVSTADSVCFGGITAPDATDPNPTLEWSHDGFNWNTANPDTGNLTDNCSTGFGPDANTMNWRAVDATGNIDSYQQTVTLTLPPGITGKACTIDLATAGSRLLEGRFTMRGSTGGIVGSIDNGVTGFIDTTNLCPGPGTTLADCNPNPPAINLNSGQPFFNFNWTASPVRLFGPGTWSFETCPLPRTEVNPGTPSADWVSVDGSNKCDSQTAPNLISMTVAPGQLGAHMLFTWATNPNIDVAVVWDVDCNTFELTTTDPDGDGILSTPMVDGPFKGFNAAFDLNTQAGEPLIADGGYTTTIPVTQNPVSGESPLAVTTSALPVFTTDPTAIRSCVGDCYKFSTTNLLSATDGGGAYNYAQVVLPLSEATPFWSVYRKYDEATMTWRPFTIDARNDVKTAPLDLLSGECLEPGNGAYDRPSHPLAGKLRGGDLCVQLTIEDDGPNDAANTVAGTVADPGGVAEVAAIVLPAPATGGGGCSIANTASNPAKGGAWWLLTGLLGWLGWNRRRRS